MSNDAHQPGSRGGQHGACPGGGRQRFTCKELCDLLTEYLEGSLADPQKTELEKHLALCPPCVDYLEQFKRTIELSKRCCCRGKATPPPMPDHMVAAIIAAMMTAKPGGNG
ncbi:MAG TPA: zf-HC2 domain-containing protein [Phycisphaerales bacterium]|nr:zf-HC2 domain-containing protein [Phycisphaerales bacterium]